MSIESRKKEHRENLKTLILENTFNIISEDGWEKLSIRLLARRIDYSPRTIYLYFQDKDALLQAVIEKAFSETLEALSTNGNRNASAEEIFRTMINRHIRNGLQQPLLYRAVIDGINKERYISCRPEVLLNEKITGLLKNLLPGDSEKDSALKTEIFLATLRGTTLMLINKKAGLTDGQIEKTISTYTEILLRGVL